MTLALSELPKYHQLRILEAVAAPHPPPKWVTHVDGIPLFQIPSRAWYEWYWQRGIDPDRRRIKIPAAMRRAVVARDGLNCQLCGGPVEPLDVHLDHIQPVSLGGPTEVSNLQVTHSLCNMRKGARVE